MNKELGLTSVVRRIKTDYRKGTAYKMFENLVHQEFHAPDLNQKWCTDFTVIDLYDRTVVASITDKNITADLAVRTVAKALKSQTGIKSTLILHSDQGSQYTSRDFVEFCEKARITQSTSYAGSMARIQKRGPQGPGSDIYPKPKRHFDDLPRRRTLQLE